MAELTQDEQTYLRRLREGTERVAQIQDRNERLEKMHELGSAEHLENGLTDIRQNFLSHLVWAVAKSDGAVDTLDGELVDLLRQSEDVDAIRPHLAALAEAVKPK